MSNQTFAEPSLARSILDQIDRLVHEAEQAQRPLEVEPYRGQLFELFVMADAADLLKETSSTEDEPPKREVVKHEVTDLSADALCRALAERWNLADATRESFSNQTRLPKQHLDRMRLLWSVMRMWMEWTYAWNRWAEFHREVKPT